MHLITQPDHVLPCSNSATKGSNGTNRPKPSQNFPRVSLLEASIPHYRVPLVGNSVKDDSSDHIMRAFPAVWFPGIMVVTPSSTHLSINITSQRFSTCNPTVDAGFVKLTSDRFCGNRVFKMNIQFCCHLCCKICMTFRTIPSLLLSTHLILWQLCHRCSR
jgi:hypothetical protein